MLSRQNELPQDWYGHQTVFERVWERYYGTTNHHSPEIHVFEAFSLGLIPM